MTLRRGMIVRDEFGNHFSIDKVGADTVTLHSVATKESWIIPVGDALLLTIVEGLVEA